MKTILIQFIFCFRNQKRNRKIINLWKRKFEEDIQLNREDKEYEEEYNKLFDKDEKIHKKEITLKKKVKYSQKDNSFQMWENIQT
jgi:hypothetical protein